MIIVIVKVPLNLNCCKKKEYKTYFFNSEHKEKLELVLN